MFKKILPIVLLSACCASANALTFSAGPNLGLAIPDNETDSVTSTISITDVGLITNLSVSVGIDHIWAGDLILDLTSPGGTTARLMDRPGFPATGLGDSSDLVSSTPIMFSDIFATPAENAGSACISSEDIGVDCTGQFSPDDSLATFFNGQSITGDWTLTVFDADSIISGSLENWALDIEVSAVPVPAAVWLMGSALLGLLGFRKRKA